MRLLIASFLMLSLAACDKQSDPAPQAEASKEPIGRVDITHAGSDAPAIPFLGPEDGPASLAAFRGKPLMVNLWATWCAPCIREMPTLDTIAGRDARFQTIVISQDMEGRRAVTPFFQKAAFKNLKPYLDKQNVLMEALKTDTLPTTIFYDAKGKEQWRVMGSMDWAGERAKTLIEGALNPPGAKS